MIGLSKSTLDIFKECGRCFWLSKNHKIERPTRPFPGITKAMDRVMKESVAAQIDYLKCDGIDLIPHPDRAMVKRFRSWRTFEATIIEEGVSIKCWGEIDELLMAKDGKVAPWDYKSIGLHPTVGYSAKYYQTQADLYDLLLTENGLKTTGHGYFTYTWPTLLSDALNIKVEYATEIVEIDSRRIRKILLEAARCLDLKKPPKPNPSCSFCNYIQDRRIFDGAAIL